MFLPAEFLADLGRFNYVTPTSYLELISSFRTLLDAKRAQNTKMKNRWATPVHVAQCHPGQPRYQDMRALSLCP